MKRNKALRAGAFLTLCALWLAQRPKVVLMESFAPCCGDNSQRAPGADDAEWQRCLLLYGKRRAQAELELFGGAYPSAGGPA